MTTAETLTKVEYALYGPVLTLRVYGLPVGQGNVRSLGTGRPSVHQNADVLLPWRQTIAAHAHNAMAEARHRFGEGPFPLTGPVGLALHFTVPKPKSAPKTRRTYPVTRPDLSHYVRAIEDAISLGGDLRHGRVLQDDSQIVWGLMTKAYPGEETHALERPGVIVRVYKIGEPHA